MLWDKIVEFFSTNKEVLAIIVSIAGTGGFGIALVNKFILPTLLNKFLVFLSKVIGKMFGIESDEVSDSIEKLPIVDKMEEYVRISEMQSELKLIEYKRLLVSDKLTDTERIAYQAMYDKVILSLGNKLTSATIMALEAIEKSAKEKFKF